MGVAADLFKHNYIKIAIINFNYSIKNGLIKLGPALKHQNLVVELSEVHKVMFFLGFLIFSKFLD